MRFATSLPAVLPAADNGQGGPYDLFAGLPLHPMVVHSVVVLVPLSFLGLLLIVLAPGLRKALEWIVLLLMAVAAGASWVAIQSGQVLATRVGEPQSHANAGRLLIYLTPLLFTVSLLWFVTAQVGSARRARKERKAAEIAAAPIGTDPLTGRPLDGPAPAPAPQGGGAFAALLAVLALAIGLLTVIWTARVGHTGAQAAWGDRIDEQPSVTASPTLSELSPSPTQTPTASPTSSPAQTATSTATPTGTGTARPATTGTSTAVADLPIYAMSDVREHGSATDCWAIVDGNVYNLTEWIDAHPGGAGVIEGLCGTDATSQFRSQHGSQPEPNSQLNGFEIGTLAQ
ncbi:MAG: cytochrome b5 domain-containing protein [Candidatus Nanopelagicales bacterium]